MEAIEIDPDPHLLSVLLSSGFYKGFSTEAIITLLILLLLLLFSGLISGSETAFFSLQPSDLQKLKHKGKKGKKVIALRERPKRLLATVLITNNFINVGIVVISSFFTALLFNFSQNPVLTFVIQIVVVTSFLLIFGEILPKIYANRNPIFFSTLMAETLAVLLIIFKPLSTVLVKSTSFIDRRMAKRQEIVSLSDLSHAIDLTVGETTPAEEKMILKGIATFGEKEASELMRSRVNVTSVEISTPFSELIQTVIGSGFSRIPVYKESFDQVRGIVYIKDLLPLLSQDNPEWKTLIRPAFFVPENKKVNALLQEFRQKKIHMAIVVDEYGGTSGIITMEDVLEEIVGEISDEFDKDDDSSRYKKLNASTWIFEASIMLNDLCKVLSVSDDFFEDYRGEADSLGGMILEIKGVIPKPGDRFELYPFEFEITDSDKRKINQVKVVLRQRKDNA
ncbi:MAG: gliding motility-associated protein GldE [Bacteroidales bacterium]|nr:gliding motility-associated protein GldE [Bacteroidales bacterium]